MNPIVVTVLVYLLSVVLNLASKIVLDCRVKKYLKAHDIEFDVDFNNTDSLLSQLFVAIIPIYNLIDAYLYLALPRDCLHMMINDCCETVDVVEFKDDSDTALLRICTSQEDNSIIWVEMMDTKSGKMIKQTAEYFASQCADLLELLADAFDFNVHYDDGSQKYIVSDTPEDMIV